MGRKEGKKLTERVVHVYVSSEKYVYLRRLLMFRKRELKMGIDQKYSMSRFLRDITSENILSRWEVLEQLNKAYDDYKPDSKEAS